jgi:hypothetical protein
MLPTALWYVQAPVTRPLGEASGVIVDKVVYVDAELHQVLDTMR